MLPSDAAFRRATIDDDKPSEGIRPPPTEQGIQADASLLISAEK